MEKGERVRSDGPGETFGTAGEKAREKKRAGRYFL